VVVIPADTAANLVSEQKLEFAYLDEMFKAKEDRAAGVFSVDLVHGSLTTKEGVSQRTLSLEGDKLA